MKSTYDILNNFGKLGVQALKNDVSKVSATGKTKESIHYKVDKETDRLTFFAREFFKSLETGRGPRKSSDYQEYDISMLEYMKARGIGSDLPDKKRKQLAKFLAYKINKEGDEVFKKGGRIVYSETLSRLVEDIFAAVRKDMRIQVLTQIKESFNGLNRE